MNLRELADAYEKTQALNEQLSRENVQLRTENVELNKQMARESAIIAVAADLAEKAQALCDACTFPDHDTSGQDDQLQLIHALDAFAAALKQ